MEVSEVFEVEAEGTVVAQVEEFREDEVAVAGLAVGGEAHELVFAGIDVEAAVVGEGRAEQTERVGESEFAEKVEPGAVAVAECGGGPLAHTVEREDCGSLEGRGIEGAGGVALVMGGEEDPIGGVATGGAEGILDFERYPELAADPVGYGGGEGAETAGGDGE